MLRQFNLFDQGHLALFQWALEVNINDLFAKISLLLDESDQAIFDLQEHISPLLNLLADGPLGLYGKGFATTSCQSQGSRLSDRR